MTAGPPKQCVLRATSILLVLFCSGCGVLAFGADDDGRVPANTVRRSVSDDGPVAARLAMVEEQMAARGIEDERVLAAMRLVPRHRFVSESFADRAYHDRAVPIGYGQPLSQPYVVALMSDALGIEPGDRVLEIGTGSGYQAAVLAEMGASVYTVEIIPELAARARTRLHDLGYAKVQVRTSDGYNGWPEQGPFDGIVVTAAPDHVPQPLVDQLAPGGTMVIPIGPPGAIQVLWSFTHSDAGDVTAESITAVEFVPLKRSSK